MAIKLKANLQRTEVRPEFWAALSHIGMGFLQQKSQEFTALPEAARRREIRKSLPVLHDVTRAIQRNDNLETHIIHSGWQSVTGIYAFDQHWLVFQLDDVICRPVKGDHPSYYLDGYTVYVPAKAFWHTDFRAIHFIPANDPDREARHPHHKIHPFEEPSLLSPLLSETSTCLGGYETWVKTALKNWHIVDLMHALRKFLCSYTYGDTLASLDTNHFPQLRVVR